MPLTLPIATLVAGLAGAASSTTSTIATNRAQRRWNQAMYNRQREDALADWARANQYNSPLAQMQRFKEAGLNPNLIYGQQNMSQPIRSTDTKSWNPQAPAFNLGQIADQYIQAKQAGEQIELMGAQQDLVRANVAGKELDNLKAAAGLPYVEDLIKARLDNMYADTEYKGVRTQFTISENARQALRANQDLEIGAAKLIGIERDNANKLTDGQIKEQQLTNLQKTETILIAQGGLKNLEWTWHQFGLTRKSSRLEWLMAQFLMDPENAQKKLDNYIKASKDVLTSGAAGTKELLDEAGNALWEKYVTHPDPKWQKENVTDNIYRDADGKIKFKRPIKFN